METAENLCLGFGCRGKGFFAKVSDRLFVKTVAAALSLVQVILFVVSLSNG